MNEKIKYNPEASCDSCGKFGAFDLGDEHLCSDSIQKGAHAVWNLAEMICGRMRITRLTLKRKLITAIKSN